LSKQSSAKATTTVVVLAGIALAVITLLFFLLFSVPAGDEGRPAWFLVGINALEFLGFVGATVLCFRNWKSSQIVSGRNVWLSMGLGMLCYSLGNILFFLWGTVWELDPAVSLGDIFYLLSYVFIGIGMLQAVLPRRLNLEVKQWALIVAISLIGIGLAYVLNYRLAPQVAQEAQADDPAAIEETVPMPEAAPPEGAAPDAAETPELTPPPEPEASEDESSAPDIVLQLDSLLQPFEGITALLYVVGDCILVALATTLLVAFWGGRFSQSWKLIAAAAFSLYIADMFFAYSVSAELYEEGALWEVFWTFSAVLFGIGAAIEYEVSTRSRRGARRRRA
jgi:hypothetical protein